MKKSRRAFIITIDAMIALVLLLMAMLLLQTEWFRPLAPDGLYLKQVSLDVLSVVESQSIMDGAIDGNASKVREIFETTPEPICMQLTIENAETGQTINTISRAGCSSYEKELQVAYNVVIHEDVTYIGKLESWYRKG